MPNEQIYCSDHSLALGEPIFATAPRIEAWILLEYPYPYSAKTFEDSQIQGDVKARLSAALKSIPHSRLLMIKKASKKDKSDINLILVKSSPQVRRVVKYRLDRYADLLAIDIESMFTDAAADRSEVTSPLYLVCTNGKRDRCCARHGMPFFREMKKYARESVWQSSHVGGHRFAANVISLPYGIYYGRLPVSAARSFLELSKKGEINLPNYRGRTCYTAEQQAAEYYLRKQTGNTKIDDLQLDSMTQVDGNRWQVRFVSRAGETYQVRIRSELSDYAVTASCDSPQKTKQQLLYYLDEIT